MRVIWAAIEGPCFLRKNHKRNFDTQRREKTLGICREAV
jgi:hypothetical protein